MSDSGTMNNDTSAAGEMYSRDKLKPVPEMNAGTERYSGNMPMSPEPPLSPTTPPLSPSLLRAAGYNQPITENDSIPTLQKSDKRLPTWLRQPAISIAALCLLTTVVVVAGLLLTHHNTTLARPALAASPTVTPTPPPTLTPTPTLSPGAATATFITTTKDVQTKPGCPSSTTGTWTLFGGKVDCSNNAESIFMGNANATYTPGNLGQDYMITFTTNNITPSNEITVGGGNGSSYTSGSVTAFLNLNWNSPRSTNSGIVIYVGIAQNGTGYSLVGTLGGPTLLKSINIAPSQQYIVQMIYHQGKVTCNINGQAISLPMYLDTFSNTPSEITLGLGKFRSQNSDVFQASFANFTYQLLPATS